MKLLNDEQIRRFIVDGFVRVKPEVPASVHSHVDEMLRVSEEHEFHYGNNIVSRIPAVWEVLRSPAVTGALTSLLGPNYYVHPHRAIHTSRPVEPGAKDYPEDFNGPPMGKGSRAGSGWHQDAQSPLSRARHHLPKFLIGFYFPHETPEIMGPTRFQAGSYMFSHPVEPSGVVLPKDIEPGAFFLLHFDTVHAGWHNRTEHSRYMLKFVFARTEHAYEPTWDAKDGEWRKPADALAGYDLSPAWKYIWRWMNGETSSNDAGPTDESRFDDLGSHDQQARLNAIYDCAQPANIPRLIQMLKASAGNNQHERTVFKNAEGKPIPRDDTRANDRRWNERAIVMEDSSYALAAIGEPAIEPLTELLSLDDPWVLINAVFALGEIGPAAASAVGELSELLRHPQQQVVRQTLDALGSIGINLDEAYTAFKWLFENTRDAWQKPEVMRGWTATDQIRMNAATTLMNACNYRQNSLDKVEQLLIKALGDSNGYVPAIASEALLRLGTPTAQQAAVSHLSDRRWDESVTARKPF